MCWVLELQASWVAVQHSSWTSHWYLCHRYKTLWTQPCPTAADSGRTPVHPTSQSPQTSAYIIYIYLSWTYPVAVQGMNSYQNQHSLRRPLTHGLFHEDYCNELIRDQNLPFPNTYQRWEMGICPNTYRKRVRKVSGKVPTHLCKWSRAYGLPGRTNGFNHQ